jgi:hypothetical protein
MCRGMAYILEHLLNMLKALGSALQALLLSLQQVR